MHENSPNRKNAIQYASRNNNNLLQCRQREAASLLPLATKVENTDRGQFWACPSMIPKVSLPVGNPGAVFIGPTRDYAIKTAPRSVYPCLHGPES